MVPTATDPGSAQHDGLAGALRSFASQDRILVCCDYDGTLAPIVADPQAAVPLPGAIEALRRLAGCERVSVAVLSGRALVDLGRLSGLRDMSDRIRLVGSHGAEFAPGEFAGFGAPQRELLDDLISSCTRIVAGVPGAAVEVKPTSVAVHVRRAPPEAGSQVLARVEDQLVGGDGVFVTHGKQVVELAVLHADKGDAIRILREQESARAVLFVGDDVTDERGFAALQPQDVGIKVGEGRTTAAHRATSPHDVLLLLRQLHRLRAA